jgi:hypothetical protein
MVSAAMPGFPPRGSTLYVFSIDGDSIATALEMPATEPGGTSKQNDNSQAGRH